MALEDPVTIPGTSRFGPRDWRREGSLARENKAILRAFEEFKRERAIASIEAVAVDDRERARIEYHAAKLLTAAIEALATLPD